MHPFAKRRIGKIAAIVVAISTLALTACSSSTPSSSGSTATAAGDAATGSLPTLESLYTGYEGLPPTSGPAVAEDKKVAFISCGELYPLCAVVGAEMTKAAAALGWDFTVFDGAGNIGGGFATAIREAIATSPDAIVLGGIDCAVAKQPLKEARDAGITILGIDNLDCDESGDGDALFTAPMYYNEEAIGGAQYWSNFGTAAAAYIANVRPDAKILAASTWETSLDSSVYAGFTAGLDNWCPDCEIVAKVGGTSAELFPSGPIDQRYQAALVAHPETTLIYSPYDNFFGSTLSIAKGVQDAGLRDQILLMGGQGAQEGTDLLRSGDIDAEPSAVDKGWMAWGALDQLNRIFNDEEPVSQGVGPRLFDETQTEGTSGNYQTTVDYATAYKDIWKK